MSGGWRAATASEITRPRLRVLRSAAPVRPKTRQRRLGLIGHAGLAATRIGGAPTRASLRRALRLGVDAIEIDVCASADASLVLHHDTRLPVGLRVADLTLEQLRRLDGELLTLEDALEVIGDRTRVIVDVKTRAAAGPVSDWFGGAGSTVDAVVCSGRTDVLRYLARSTPGAAIWQTFPDFGELPHERVLRVLSSVAAHRGHHARHLAGDLWNVLGRAHKSPRHAAGQLAGLPWRTRLPSLLESARGDFGAGGIAVHHALLTPELCAVAHELGMTVVAWTVNSAPVAHHAAACGADLITTDDVVGMRRALGRRRRDRA